MPGTYRATQICTAGSRPRPTPPRTHLPQNFPAASRRGGEAAVSPRLSGGVKTPPYGKREHGSSDRRSQQDKIARAACRPPLQLAGTCTAKTCCFRQLVGRGLDPAAGTSRQARRFHNKPPGFPIDVGAACTPPGNVAVARNVPGHANLHGGVRPRPARDLPGSENTPRRGQDPALRKTGTRQQRPAFATR